jgi:hypothetical protein
MAFWFGLVMAAPAILHACPTALATQSATAADAEHGSHGADHSAGQGQDSPTECQCLGTCAVSVPALLATSAGSPVAVLTPTDAGATPVLAAVVIASRSDHSQPFATAPPLRSV